MLALVAGYTAATFMSVPVNRIAVGIGLFTALSMGALTFVRADRSLAADRPLGARDYRLAISAFMSPSSSRVISPRAYRSLRISNAPLLGNWPTRWCARRSSPNCRCWRRAER